MGCGLVTGVQTCLFQSEQGALAADGAALGREDSGRDCAGVGILVAGRAAGGGSEKPVGVIEQLRADERGLRVIGRLSARTAVGREAAALLKAGAVDGLSFGYRVQEASEGRTRELRACAMLEVSLVTFRMQPPARGAGGGGWCA